MLLGIARFGALISTWIFVNGLACGASSASRDPTNANPDKSAQLTSTLESLDLSDGGSISYELGTLVVPENRKKADSRSIKVGFARFKSTQPSNIPPIFLLPGGPGSSYLMDLKKSGSTRYIGLIDDIKRYRRISDLVLVDQRGYSELGEVLKFQSSPAAAQSLEQEVEAYQAFAQEAVAHFANMGVDLSGYTVIECAEDVNALRAALGYEKIILNGTSFGSQWSFAIMRLHPESVARALLSGVEPLDYGYDMPSHVFAAYQRMWWTAEQDERFRPYLPPGGIAQAALAVKERLEREGIQISLHNDGDGETINVALSSEHLPSMDPASILAFYYGHHESWIEKFSQSQTPEEVRLVGPLIDSSLGVTPSRRYRLWTDPATRFLGRGNFAAYLATADIWPSPDVGDDFRRPAVNDIPAVFAQGDWDTSTPIENTYEIAPYFRKGRVLVAERGGHGVLRPIADQLPDVWKTIEAFLRTGDMDSIPTRVTLAPSRQFDPLFHLPAD